MIAGTLTFEVEIEPQKDVEAVERLQSVIEKALESLPGVDTATFTDSDLDEADDGD